MFLKIHYLNPLICAIIFLTSNSLQATLKTITNDTLQSKAKKSEELYKSENDIKFKTETRDNKYYIRHYRYRFTISPQFNSIKTGGNTSLWNMSSTTSFYSFEIEASSQIRKNHSINLSFSYCIKPGKQNFTILDETSYSFEIFVHQINLFYLYTFIKGGWEFSPGIGEQLIMYDVVNNLKFSLKGTSLRPVFIGVVSKLISKRIKIFGKMSYSVQQMKIENRPVDGRDFQSAQMRNFQINVGLQFLTAVSDIFY